MQQIIQDLKNGNTILEEVPVPQVQKGCVLIKTKISLVSAGTERMLVEFGQSNIISKARQQPEKVKIVLEKIKTDGLVPTLETVFKKLDEPLPLGYCNAGEVIEVGEGVDGLKPGDRVISNGNHAEVVCVPKNLVAPIPDNVSYEEASFTVIASIALQGIRLANPTFGETVVVIGLGLIGIITCQLLLAHGCNVIGFDVDSSKIELIKNKGIKAFNSSNNLNEVKLIQDFTEGFGADAVIITASSKSNNIISKAAQMSRKRGRIVLVGVVGLDINRSDFYEKELSFQVSCSYGPGRYDENYESKGIDYPLPYVRWPENRNFNAVLEAISSGKLEVKSLISEVVNLEDYKKIYDNISGSGSIASLLKYPDSIIKIQSINIVSRSHNATNGTMAIIGAGNFTNTTLLPILSKIGADIKYICSSKGLSGTTLAKKYKISYSTTDYNSILDDNDIASVFITTRHNLHAEQAVRALKCGKHVFVEKPLALSKDELEIIIEAKARSDKSVMVGFNRRFSPFAQKVKSLLAGSDGYISVIATVNAGYISNAEWVQDLELGGGRIIGEACHFIDLITFFVNSKVKSVVMEGLGVDTSRNSDTAVLTIKYENGALGVINYFANGNKFYSKERIEIYSQGRNIVIDNFRSMKGYGFKGFSKMKSKQDKGHLNQFKLYKQFLENGGTPPIHFDEIVNTTYASFAAIESLMTGKIITV